MIPIYQVHILSVLLSPQEVAGLTPVKFIIELALQEGLMVQEAFGCLRLRDASLTKPWSPPDLLRPLGLLIRRDAPIRNRCTIFIRNHAASARRREIILIRSTVILYVSDERHNQDERKCPDERYRSQLLPPSVACRDESQEASATRPLSESSFGSFTPAAEMTYRSGLSCLFLRGGIWIELVCRSPSLH